MEYPAVTQERIEQALTSLELNFERDEDGDTVLGFEELVCFFGVNDNNFVGWANWRGAATTEEDIAQLHLVINEVNKEVPMLRTSAREGEAGVWPQGFTLFPTPEGVSDEQLKNMLDYFFYASHFMAAMLSEHIGHIKFEVPENEGEES